MQSCGSLCRQPLLLWIHGDNSYDMNRRHHFSALLPIFQVWFPKFLKLSISYNPTYRIVCQGYWVLRHHVNTITLRYLSDLEVFGSHSRRKCYYSLSECPSDCAVDFLQNQGGVRGASVFLQQSWSRDKTTLLLYLNFRILTTLEGLWWRFGVLVSPHSPPQQPSSPAKRLIPVSYTHLTLPTTPYV